jgi:hypothetical protein
MALVSRFLWYQHFPDVRIFLVSGFLWYQQSSGIREILVLEKFCIKRARRVISLRLILKVLSSCKRCGIDRCSSSFTEACTKSSRRGANCNDVEDSDLILLPGAQPKLNAGVRAQIVTTETRK